MNELVALYPRYGKTRPPAPEGATLVETRVHKGWVDICYINDKGVNVYLTTRPDI